MTFEVTFDDEEAAIVEDYLKRANTNISKFARRAILETIFQDDDDLAAFEQAMEEYKKNPTTYTLSEVESRFGMS